jgi:hypothetical protein
MWLALLTCVLIATPTIGVGQSSKNEKVSLPPTAFPELPVNLVKELQRRECLIPQGAAPNQRNVIKGEFLRRGQADWAVVCSSKGTQTLLVFANGSEKTPFELFKGVESNTTDYETLIRAAAPQHITEIFNEWKSRNPRDLFRLPAMDHQGIERGSDSLSVFVYFDGKRWLTMPGNGAVRIHQDQ